MVDIYLVEKAAGFDGYRKRMTDSSCVYTIWTGGRHCKDTMSKGYTEAEWTKETWLLRTSMIHMYDGCFHENKGPGKKVHNHYLARN